MKNRNLIQQRLELSQKLLEVVNSQEEYEFLQADINQSFYSIQMKGGKC